MPGKTISSGDKGSIDAPQRIPKVASSVLQERRVMACQNVEEDSSKSKDNINSSPNDQSADMTSSSQPTGVFNHFPPGVFEGSGSLVIPKPITNFVRREEIMPSETDERFSQFPSMAWNNKGQEPIDDLLTKNLRGPGTPPTPMPVLKEEYDLADFGSAAENNHQGGDALRNTTSVLAVSRGNLEHVYLCQQTVYRFMNLANMIRSNGWDLGNSGIDILGGSVVLVSRGEQWKLRRIKSWCIDTMSITLEDGTLVWPLDLYNHLLIEDELHVKYALEEYTHQIHVNRLERFTAEEILETFHTLVVCSDVLRQLSESTQEYPAISELVTRLHENSIGKYLPSFLSKLQPANLQAEQEISDEHEQLIRHRDPRLKNHFSVWMGMHFTNEKREAYLKKSYCLNHMSDSFLRIHGAIVKEWGLDASPTTGMRKWQQSPSIFEDIISLDARFLVTSETENENKADLFPGNMDSYASAVLTKSEGQLNYQAADPYAGCITTNGDAHSTRIDEGRDSSICMAHRLNFLQEEVSAPGLIRFVCPIGISKMKHKDVQHQNADEFTFFEGDLPKPVLVDDDCHHEVYVCQPIPPVASMEKNHKVLNQPSSLLGAAAQETSCKMAEKEPIKKISRKRKSTQAPTMEKIRRK